MLSVFSCACKWGDINTHLYASERIQQSMRTHYIEKGFEKIEHIRAGVRAQEEGLAKI